MLFECLTGERAFAGGSLTDVVAAIVARDPDWSRLPSATPAPVVALLGRCLEKDPQARLSDIGEARGVLAAGGAGAGHGVAAAPPAPAVARRRRALRLALGPIVLLAVAAGLYLARAGTSSIDFLAVLPFENASAEPGTEYFSDGLTESVISRLSQLPGVKVISRTSAFHYKGQAVDPREVGRELGVDALVLGRVDQRGGELVLGVELVDARDGGRVWGRRYQRRAADVLGVQEEVAREISEALRLQLTSEEQARLTRRETSDPEAYKAYLRGRYHWNERTLEGLRQAIEDFQDAIERDPTYARAYSGLADCHSLLGYYYLPAREAYPRAKAAATRALEHDDSLAEAHTSLAFVLFFYEWDFEAGQRAFRRALELNPSYATARHWYALTFEAQGRYDEALEQMRNAVELDPLSLIIQSDSGIFLAEAGHPEEAEEQVRRTVEIDPDFAHAQLRLGWMREYRGRYAEAIPAYEKAMELGSGYGLGHLGHAYARVGDEDRAHQVLAQLERARSVEYVRPTEIAYVYAGLGEIDRCFEWLETAYEERVSDLLLLRFRFERDLGDDPRLDQLLRRIGLE